ITAGAACVASVVVAWPDPAATSLHAILVVLLLFVVGTLMVSTVRFPSSKQKKSWGALVLLVVNLGLLAWLQASYFVLFFVVYIAFTLALNLAWKRGWKGIAPPVVYDDI
ncbi:MAG TPA: CDP-diacylglycerol--serine O-phosphatidyltransferase, partial [Duganella sp.]